MHTINPLLHRLRILGQMCGVDIFKDEMIENQNNDALNGSMLHDCPDSNCRLWLSSFVVINLPRGVELMSRVYDTLNRKLYKASHNIIFFVFFQEIKL